MERRGDNVGEAFSRNFGICTKRDLKSKRKLEYGPKWMMEEYFKDSKSMKKGCAMEKLPKGGKQL
jgi:hypothetical protein